MLKFVKQLFKGIENTNDPELVASHRANRHLREYLKDQGVLVKYYGGGWHSSYDESSTCVYLSQGIVINREPIRPSCTHPPEKTDFELLIHEPNGIRWFCKCGAKVHPTKYEEIT